MCYGVFEVFKSDGRKFLIYENEDFFTCTVWADHYSLDCRSVIEGRSEIVIEKI